MSNLIGFLADDPPPEIIKNGQFPIDAILSSASSDSFHQKRPTSNSKNQKPSDPRIQDFSMSSKNIAQTNDLVAANNKQKIGAYNHPGRHCFCNHDLSDCVNGTCWAKPDAACFRNIVYSQDGWGRWVPDPRSELFGCFEPHGQTVFQCRAGLLSHAVPKSIKCCYENDHYTTLLTSYYGKLIACTTLGVLGFLIVLLGYICYRLSKRRHERKGSKFFGSTKNKAHLPLIRGSKDLSDADSRDLHAGLAGESSGSGSGCPQLVHRTIAKDVQIIRKIGEGRYGAVNLGVWRGDYIAVKVFFTLEEASWQNERDTYQTFMLRHENILGFIAADIIGINSVTQMLLFTDYHQFGSLYDYLKRDRPLSMLEAVQLAHSTSAGLVHLHTEIHGTTGTAGKPAIAHRDIKSKNILVKAEGVCCIADFGLAVKYSSKTGEFKVPSNHRVGTKRYMAPELLDNRLKHRSFESFEKVDIYAYALVLWEITRRIQADDEPPEQHDDEMLLASSQPTQGGGPNYYLDVEMSGNNNDNQNNNNNSTSGMGDSGISSGGSSGSDGNHQLSGPPRPPEKRVSTPVAKEYLCPFGDLAPNDPSFEEMRQIVCVQEKRPEIDPSWRKNEVLHTLVELMEESWSGKPEIRNKALRIKKTLKEKVIRSLLLRSSGKATSQNAAASDGYGYHHQYYGDDIGGSAGSGCGGGTSIDVNRNPHALSFSSASAAAATAAARPVGGHNPRLMGDDHHQAVKMENNAVKVMPRFCQQPSALSTAAVHHHHHHHQQHNNNSDSGHPTFVITSTSSLNSLPNA